MIQSHRPSHHFFEPQQDCPTFSNGADNHGGDTGHYTEISVRLGPVPTGKKTANLFDSIKIGLHTS